MERRQTAQEAAQELSDAVAALRDAILKECLPFFAWLLPKLGLRLKLKYRAMLDD